MSEFDSFFGKINLEMITRIREKTKEIEKLYGASEAEMQLVSQYQQVLRIAFGHSPELHIKLLRVLTAVSEVVMDEMKEKK